MRTQNLDFQVEPRGGDNFIVRWSENGYNYSFRAQIDIETDQLLKVLCVGMKRFPTIVQTSSKGRHTTVQHIDCANSEAAAVVLNATRAIRNGKLASRAKRELEARRATYELQRIAQEAQDVRRALRDTLAAADDVAVALGLEPMDSANRQAVQLVRNLPDSFLARVARTLRGE